MKLPVILGPTGVGKTEVAIEVAIGLGAEVISCDSRQVYKYMDIGTAKPTKGQLKKVPHHMIDIITPDVAFNAWDYALRAREAIQGVTKYGKLPIVVGGSGLYLRALIDGFFRVPKPVAEGFSAKGGCASGTSHRNLNTTRVRLQGESSDKLYKRLVEIDKPTATKLHPNDRQRIGRAIEVYEATGIPMSELKAMRTPFNCEPVYIGLTMPRDKLYQKIEDRVDWMIENGFTDEVQSLLRKGYSPNLNSLQTIGYKEFIAHLAGQMSLSEAIRLIKRNTRHYTKRQLTWFSHIPDVTWIEATNKVSNLKTQISNIFCSQ